MPNDRQPVFAERHSRYLLAAASAFALASCAGPPSQIIGSTPAMVTICQAPADPWQRVLELAQAHCAGFGKNAEVTGRAGECSRGSGTYPGPVTHFRCTTP